jgi:hypothetical protein
LKRVALVVSVMTLFLLPGASPSIAQYDGSFTNVYAYQAWIEASAAKKKRSYAIHYKKKRYAKRSKSAATPGYSGGASLGGIVSTLQARCGAKVISSHRPGSVTPGGVQSCHATGQAVDMTGNYACMLSVLRSWPGGYTTDPGRCKHIHISSCKMEWGMRFNHRTC